MQIASLESLRELRTKGSRIVVELPQSAQSMLMVFELGKGNALALRVSALILLGWVSQYLDLRNSSTLQIS